MRRNRKVVAATFFLASSAYGSLLYAKCSEEPAEQVRMSEAGRFALSPEPLQRSGDAGVSEPQEDFGRTVEALRSRNAGRRIEQAEAAGGIYDREVVSALIDILSNDRAAIKWEAAISLTRTIQLADTDREIALVEDFAPSLTRAFISGLGERDDRVRNQSVVALASLGILYEEDQALSAVRDLLHSSDRNMRRNAVEVLGSANDGAIFDEIIRILGNDPDPQVRVIAAEQIGASEADPVVRILAVPALRRALEDRNVEVRAAAEEALEGIRL
jgi:HEAT repeat protein